MNRAILMYFGHPVEYLGDRYVPNRITSEGLEVVEDGHVVVSLPFGDIGDFWWYLLREVSDITDEEMEAFVRFAGLSKAYARRYREEFKVSYVRDGKRMLWVSSDGCRLGHDISTCDGPGLYLVDVFPPEWVSWFIDLGFDVVDFYSKGFCKIIES